MFTLDLACLSLSDQDDAPARSRAARSSTQANSKACGRRQDKADNHESITSHCARTTRRPHVYVSIFHSLSTHPKTLIVMESGETVGKVVLRVPERGAFE